MLVKIPNIQILPRQKEGAWSPLPTPLFVRGPDGAKIKIKQINKEGKKGASRQKACKQPSKKVIK